MTSSVENLRIYCVFDEKSGLYGMPHFLQSDGLAIRSFSGGCDDPNTDLNRYPEDFFLYYVGDFNVVSGELTSRKPLRICAASEFIRSKSKNTSSEETEEK
jgi:hypothetical protein